jgi:formylglycine-generating enzyme required for sulfatase activity
MRIFLSYRRSDTGATVGRFSDKLLTRVSADSIFFDIDSIEQGENFEDRILATVSEADWVLVFIGAGWLSPDSSGASRIHNPQDYVRREVQTALACGRKVLPVLVDDAQVPAPEVLPHDIRALVKHKGAVLRHASFHHDADAIISHLIPNVRLEPADACTFYIGPPRSKYAHKAVAGSGLLHQFQDELRLPRLVLVPRGQFAMAGRTIESTQPFAITQSPITVAEFEAFVQDTGYEIAGACSLWSGTYWSPSPSASFRTPGFLQSGTHPAVCVSWADAQSYAAWASELTAECYRLCSEAEWEFAARAGVQKSVWWTSGRAREYVHSSVLSRSNEGTVPVETLVPNGWGLRHVLGNVLEWTADTWLADLSNVPAVMAPCHQGSRTLRVVRGGAWNLDEDAANLTYRAPLERSRRYNNTGFRLVRELRTA